MNKGIARVRVGGWLVVRDVDVREGFQPSALRDNHWGRSCVRARTKEVEGSYANWLKAPRNGTPYESAYTSRRIGSDRSIVVYRRKRDASD